MCMDDGKKDEQGSKQNQENVQAKSQEQWQQFYQKTLSRPHHTRTELAANTDNRSINVAIDCGCGSGADTAYLADQGYQVIGFDINREAIEICQTRFEYEPWVKVHESSFEDFNYPMASLIIANASLFFAKPDEFYLTWLKLTGSLEKGGVFAGDFLGLNDDWAKAHSMPITALSKSQVFMLFEDFDVIEFHERDEIGSTQLGKKKHWHTYSVIAIKK